MKETYLNITEECDAIDELCVICLEIEDNFKNRTVIHSKFLNSQCHCHYYIHKRCFDKWLEKRPNENTSCLICSSKAKLVLSHKNRCIKILNGIRFKKCCTEFCKCIQIFLCLSFLWVMLTEFDNDENNTHE
tara:strand:- start:2075 stop:2470 length:396 start_codon:yes stop_codon:yes gene_type:complete